MVQNTFNVKWRRLPVDLGFDFWGLAWTYIELSVNQIWDLLHLSKAVSFCVLRHFKMRHFLLTALTFIIWGFPIFYAENFNYSSSKNVGIKLIPDCGWWYGLNGASSLRNTKIQYLTLKVDLGILIKPLFISTFWAKIHFDA